MSNFSIDQEFIKKHIQTKSKLFDLKFVDGLKNSHDSQKILDFIKLLEIDQHYPEGGITLKLSDSTLWMRLSDDNSFNITECKSGREVYEKFIIREYPMELLRYYKGFNEFALQLVSCLKASSDSEDDLTEDLFANADSGVYGQEVKALLKSAENGVCTELN